MWFFEVMSLIVVYSEMVFDSNAVTGCGMHLKNAFPLFLKLKKGSNASKALIMMK